MKAGTESIGYVIAYVVPGSVTLWGLSKFSIEVRTGFGIAAEAETSVGGFLFIVLAALALGLFVSGLRWLLIDHLLHATGTSPSNVDFSGLSDPGKLEAFDRITEGHYRFYQFYANMLIALLAAYVMWLVDLGVNPWRRPAALVSVTLTSISLLLTARDALGKYYDRRVKILGEADG